MGKQAAAIGDNLRREVGNVMKALALEIDKELRKATPVDTGHARRNWVPSVGQPHESEESSDAAHAAGVVAVLGYVLGDPLWVANNVPYINALNYGHSKQRPAGFVERAVDIAFQRVQQRYVGPVDISAMRESWIAGEWAVGNTNIAEIGL